MIKLKENYKTIISKGLDSSVIRKLKPSINDKIEKQEAELISTELQNYITNICGVFLDAIDTRTISRDDRERNQLLLSGKNNNFKSYTDFICFVVLKDRALRYDILSTLVNQKSNGMKHYDKKEDHSINIGKAIIVFNRFLNKLNEFTQTTLFNQCKLENKKGKTTKERMFASDENIYQGFVDNVELQIELSGKCTINRFKKSAAFPITVNWNNKGFDNEAILLRISANNQHVMDFKLRLDKPRGYYVIKCIVDQENIGDVYQKMNITGEVIKQKSWTRKIKRLPNETFATDLSAKLCPAA